MSKRVPGALFSAYIGQYMTLIESQGPHFSEDLSSWGPQVNLGQINLPECEGRISGEFAELMTASCRAAVPLRRRPRWRGSSAWLEGHLQYDSNELLT